MKRNELTENIFRKKSFLCVGLDPDIRKLPACLQGSDGRRVADFCKAIVDATAPYAVAFKPNTAFFESLGAPGWEALAEVVAHIRANHPDQFIIADAKRGDIGNTAALYARTFFETLDVDAVTLNPYMGEDSVRPFLDHKGKWSVILALTSNPSATDFETVADAKGMALYERVLRRSRHWGSPVDTMYVVGATRADSLDGVRAIVPRHFLLVPGVGAQGGSLEEVAAHGMIDECGLLVNSSRAIIYASAGEDFAAAAAAAAADMAARMAPLLPARPHLRLP
ncbi:MAG: orotidine-5'-phosphate decarboxylase [Muribaculaceae bacterium]|nr:orotidine-5'-phosphate decarboxylase [Muribaculaceae bacterium]